MLDERFHRYRRSVVSRERAACRRHFPLGGNEGSVALLEGCCAKLGAEQTDESCAVHLLQPPSSSTTITLRGHVGATATSAAAHGPHSTHRDWSLCSTNICHHRGALRGHARSHRSSSDTKGKAAIWIHHDDAVAKKSSLSNDAFDLGTAVRHTQCAVDTHAKAAIGRRQRRRCRQEQKREKSSPHLQNLPPAVKCVRVYIAIRSCPRSLSCAASIENQKSPRLARVVRTRRL
jgi:hypothetical protein